MPLLRDFFDWQRYGDRYLPDENEPGSWEQMYWWRIIDGIYAEWEAEKHRPDDEKQGFDYGTPDTGEDPEEDWYEDDLFGEQGRTAEPERKTDKPRLRKGRKKPVLLRDRKRSRGS